MFPVNLFRKTITVLFFAVPLITSAQKTPISIDDTKNIEDVVKSLQGPGTEITNITFSQPNGLSSIGSFDDIGDQLGLKKGLLLTTETALGAIGPNNMAGELSNRPNIAMTDADLASITLGPFFDITIVEFDIKTVFPKFSLRYVFGSDEYPEFVSAGFNDTFGLFISGPGINGKKNLAQLDDGEPISVTTINALINNDLFISNGNGDTPDVNYYLQYDGLTRKLTASTNVQVNETYHIKIVIADVKDNNYDSGVFLEAESFVSEIPYDVSVSYENDVFDYAIEGCNKGFITIERSADNAQAPLVLNLMMGGSAQNGNDYDQVQEGIMTLAPGELKTVITINALVDGIPESDESVVANFTNPASGSFSIARLTIRDKMLYAINVPPIVCANVPTVITNDNATPNLTFNWTANDGLSCLQCASPTVTFSQTTDLSVEVEETASGCKTDIDLTINVDHIDTSFPEINVCENVRVTLNQNALSGYDFTWSPNPALSCTHCAFPIVRLNASASFPVSILHVATGCTAQGQADVKVKKVEYSFDPITTCSNEPVVVVGTSSGAGPYRFQWMPDTRLSCLTCMSPTVTTKTDVLLKVDVTDTGLGCDVQLTVPVQVVKFNLPVGQQEVCQNILSVIHVDEQAGYSFMWLPDDRLSCSNCNSPSVELQDDATFMLKVTESISGCTETLPFLVEVQKLTASFTYDVVDEYSSILTSFKNESEGADEYTWDFGDGISSSEREPMHEYEPKGDTLEIELTVVSDQGLSCEARTSQTIVLHEPVFIPNVITSNNDAYNQYFKVKGIESGVWQLNVINSWGNTVYSSHGYNNDWAADNVASGTYYYELRNPNDKKSFRGWLQIVK